MDISHVIPFWLMLCWRVIAGVIGWALLLSWSERGKNKNRKIVLWLLVAVAFFWPLYFLLVLLSTVVLKLACSTLKAICVDMWKSHLALNEMRRQLRLASIEALRCPSCKKPRARVGDGSRVTGQKEYKEAGTKVVFSTPPYYGKQGYVPGEGIPGPKMITSKEVPCVYNVRIVYSTLYYHCRYCGFKWERNGEYKKRWENKD